MGFADSLKRNIENSQKNVSREVLQRAIKLGTYIVDYSPLQVDAEYPGIYAKGLFANSWFPSVNEFDPSVGVADPSASGSYGRVKSLEYSNAFLRQDDFISFSNNVSYAARVEFLGWPAEDGYTGFIGPYAPVRNAIIKLKGELKL